MWPMPISMAPALFRRSAWSGFTRPIAISPSLTKRGLSLRKRKPWHRDGAEIVRVRRRGVRIPGQQNLRLAVHDRIAVVLQARDVLHARIFLIPLGVTTRHLPRCSEGNRVLDGDVGLH